MNLEIMGLLLIDVMLSPVWAMVGMLVGIVILLILLTNAVRVLH